MSKTRPVNLDLLTLKYPPMAIVSILHRISGVLIFLLFPFILYFLKLSMENKETYIYLQSLLSVTKWKFLIWCFSVAFMYHFLAGIRHLLMDLGWGEDLSTGRNTAIFLLGITFILAIFLGIWLW